MLLTDHRWNELLETRATDPAAVTRAWADRPRRPLLAADGRLFLLAADHPARSALSVGGDPLAMADRRDLLERLLTALEEPGVDGLLGSPDILEELLLLGALGEKVAIGTMNRAGLVGSVWELDDRMTAYDTASLVDAGIEDPIQGFRQFDERGGRRVSRRLFKVMQRRIRRFICHN